MRVQPAEAPRGWIRTGEIDGIPLWRRTDEPLYVATHDADQLLFIAAALTLFDRMEPAEFRAFVTRHAPRRT